MAKSLFEELGGKYERQGDYLIPCLTVPAEEEQAIGIWGQRHLDYLKQYRKVTYTNLLTSGRLNAYLADINRQAQERFELIEAQMRSAEGVTEELKRQNPMEWVRHCNNIRNRVAEIIKQELIDVYYEEYQRELERFLESDPETFSLEAEIHHYIEILEPVLRGDGQEMWQVLDRIISAKNSMEGIVAKEMYIRGFLDYERLVCEKDNHI